MLAGRDAELETLRGRMGSGAVVVISGPAGIGKTRLAAELAREAVRRRIDVVYTTTPAEVAGRTGLVTPRRRRRGRRGSRGGSRRARARPAAWRGEATSRSARSTAPPSPRSRPLYLTPAAAEAQADALTAATGGIPLAVHRTAAEWAHSEAATLVAASAQRAAAERTDLRAAEDDLAGKLVGLQVAQERLIVDDAPPDAALCPYLGPDDVRRRTTRGYFFGRERLVAELVARLVGSPLLAVVGPSGSGKSSAVRAGLLPALAGGVAAGLGALAARAHPAGRPSPPARAPAAAGGPQRARGRPVRGGLHGLPRRRRA